MSIDIIAILLLGIGVGAWNAYLYFKIKQIEDFIPTPEEIAKEVIKVKIPLSDLPPEMQEQVMRGGMHPIPGFIPPQGKNPLVG
jgi:hypothetical protein